LFQLRISGIRKTTHPKRKTILPIRPKVLLSVRLFMMKKMAHTKNNTQPAR